MSFWETTGKILGKVATVAGGLALEAGKELISQSKNYNEKKRDAIGKETSDLFSDLESNDGATKVSAYQELKNRGFSTEDIKQVMEIDKTID